MLSCFTVLRWYQDVLQKSNLMFHMSGRPRERLTCSTRKQIVFGASENINKAHPVMLIPQQLRINKLRKLQGVKARGSQARKVDILYLPANSALFNDLFSDHGLKDIGLQNSMVPKITKLLGSLAPHLWSPYTTDVETPALTWLCRLCRLCRCLLLHLGDRIQPPIQAGTLL